MMLGQTKSQRVLKSWIKAWTERFERREMIFLAHLVGCGYLNLYYVARVGEMEGFEVLTKVGQNRVKDD